MFCLAWIVPLFFLLVVEGAHTAQAEVVFTPVGTPVYVPADLHLFSAPIGTAADGFAEFAQNQQALLPPPNHVRNPVLGIGPGAAHAGPYDREFTQGVAANSFVDASVFRSDQYSNGNGVYLVFMFVPSASAPIGSSPDFVAGPILPNGIFPLSVNGSTRTNGVINDTLGQFQVPAIDQVPGFTGLDGHSHVPFFLVDSFEFAARPIPGAYEYQISIIDVANNGYNISASFEVLAVLEPPIWMTTGIASIAVGGLALSRRKRRWS